MDGSQIFTFAHPEYFERLLHTPDDGKYREVVLSHLSDDWNTSRNDVWFEAQPAGFRMPDQGFKIHISACSSDAEPLLTSVLPVLVKTRTPFKVVASRLLHRLVNSKRYGRQAAGKFITVYPPTNADFTSLLESLDKETREYRGPYILSDRRYRKSEVLFYRYGGFRNIPRLRHDGTQELCIVAPDGELIPDERSPYFQLPAWVTDPFPEEETPMDSDLIHGRYRPEEALNFTSVGGVYRAVDELTGQIVVLKEARPHIATLPSLVIDRSAMESLRHEGRCLLALQELPFVPRFIEQFRDWEHDFLVESFEPGIPLASFRAQSDFIILSRMYDGEKLAESCRTWKDIALQLISMLECVHKCGFLIGDLSPVNILRDAETGKLTLIDLEGMVEVGTNGQETEFSLRWAFPGFRPAKREDQKALSPLDDYFAAAMVLYNLICPVHNLFEFSKSFPREVFLKHFVQGGLPQKMEQIIDHLAVGNLLEAKSNLTEFVPEQGIFLPTTTELVSRLEADRETAGFPSVPSIKNFAGAITAIAEEIVASQTSERDDRLWPADAIVFQNNSLSLSHGACGIASFLYDTLDELPGSIYDWIQRRPVDVKNYPPGWASGMAGIAWCLERIGRREQGREIFLKIAASSLAFSAPDYYDGAAGWGNTALALFHRSQEEELLDMAKAAAHYLLKTAHREGKGFSWTCTDGLVHLGFGLGASGIAFFLLELWKITKEPQWVEAAIQAMEFDIHHGTERGEALVWGTTSDATTHSPYWLRGGGGVTSALIRFFQTLGDRRYLELAQRAVLPSLEFFSVAPHLFEGVASMGETLLDMYWVTGERSYYDAALLKGHQAMLFAIERQKGIAFPGRFLYRISHDYAVGGAGVGTFLHRLLHPGPRKFIDPEF